MPRAFMFTKEEIISAAVELTREKGFSALTARAKKPPRRARSLRG